MGRNKQSQRTKGNVRPSSSTRSAELLSGTGLAAFSGLSVDLPSYVPATGQHTEDADATVDGDFRMVMRKMTKRDTTTKLRAVQEFLDLCIQKDVETIKGALPFWPRLYNKMAVDHDRRVREATHDAHKQLALKVKHNLAPHLKSIMGVWLISQCDPYAPAACASTAAFNAAFPKSKQADALVFCKEEILLYLDDLLFRQTPQTLSDSRISSEEEMESKYVRMLSCSLLGLKLFIIGQSEEFQQKLHEPITKILAQNKFWKYSKHKDSLVRGAWYYLITCLCQHMPAVLNNHTDKLCASTLGCLAEGDPAVAPIVWEAALYTIVTFEDCWQKVNIKKTLLPQLWNLLKEGGKGNAVFLFPNLLPLLSKIPDDLKEEIYKGFFNNMAKGLLLDKVQKSPAECNAVVQAFIECLSYAISHQVKSSRYSNSLVEILIKDELLAVVKSSINNTDSYLPFSTFYPLLGEMLRSLENQVGNTEGSEMEKDLRNILSLFWNELFAFIFNVIEEKCDQQFQSLERIAQLFISMYHPRARKRSKAKVQFADSVDNVPQAEAKLDELVCPNLSEDSFIVCNLYRLCKVLLEKLNQELCRPYLRLLSKLVGIFPNEKLFFSLVYDNKESIERDLHNAPLEFFHSKIYPWIIHSESMCDKENALDLAISVCYCSSEATAQEILHKLIKINDPILLYCILHKGAALTPLNHVIKIWFDNPIIGGALVQLVDDQLHSILNTESEDYCQSQKVDAMWKSLRIIFTSLESSYLISSEYIEKILELFQKCLKKTSYNRSDNKNGAQLIKFVCDLAASLFSSYKGCWQLAAAEDLLITLFSLGLYIHDSNLPESIKFSVTSVWEKGVSQMLQQSSLNMNNDGFLIKAATLIHSCIMNISSLQGAEDLLDTTLKFLITVEENLSYNSEDLLHPILRILLTTILPSQSEWLNVSSHLNTVFSPLICLNGWITWFPMDKVPEFQKSCASRNIFISIFCCEILNALTNHLSKKISENEPSDRKESVLDDILSNSIHFILLSYSVYLENQSRRNLFEVSESHKSKLYQDFPDNVKCLLQRLSSTETVSLLEELQSQSLNQGYLWSITLLNSIPLLKVENVFFSSAVTDLIKELKICRINDLHTLQACVSFLPSDALNDLVSTAVNYMVCQEELTSITGVFSYLSTAASCLNAENISFSSLEKEIIMALDFLIGLKFSAKNDFLCARDISTEEEENICFSSQTASFLSSIVSKFSSSFDVPHWDFILCTLVNWLKTCEISSTYIGSNITATNFACSVYNLSRTVIELFQSSESARNNTIPENILMEWKDLYCNDIYVTIVMQFLQISEKCGLEQPGLIEEYLIQFMVAAIEQMPACHHLITNKVPAKYVAVQESELKIPEEFNHLLNHLVPLLLCNSKFVQMGAHLLLLKTMPSLAEQVVFVQDESEKTNEVLRPPPTVLENILHQTSSVVEEILSELRIGECCIIDPFTEGYVGSTAYLLAWMQLLDFFSASSSEARSEYASYLHEMGLMQSLLSNLFRMMPENPVLYSSSKNTSNKGCASLSMFTMPLHLDINEPSSYTQLQHLACQVYLSSLKKIPALVRQWWNNQDKRTADIVNRFTSKYVSGVISCQEIQAVHGDNTVFNNMTIKARPAAREVVASYTIDDVTTELLIQLPVNYPLGPVTVDSQKRIGVGNTQWRKWMLQLTTFLTYQNGSILDGLSLWKSNMDKKFEGVEECMICFYVLHGSTCQLPRLSCHTCKKKFHSACLYKWFSTSNNCTCPLCRNLF